VIGWVTFWAFKNVWPLVVIHSATTCICPL
jgi:hypothetical protein